ncbi:MAG TPA: murein biosynthesis integral membrane protein MurJ [Vicinamibacteria bacterium]|nr:murein biosynthesis integral membrane protein MurJ [Vicinamibacteria bacterium]
MTTTTEIKAAAEKSRIARAAGLVSAMTLVSRLLGLVREFVFAILLGAGVYSDAFRIGFRIPNLLRDLFAEGALSAAFVPTYARVSKEAGQDEAFRLANRVLSLLAVLLGAVVLLGILFAGPLVAALAPGFEKVAGKTELTVLLTRIMMPFLPLVSFAAVAMGMLNAEERFAMPALSPALFNLVTIAWAGVLWARGLPPEKVAIGWAVGTLLGGLAQFLCQMPSLWRAGWRPRLEWAPLDPGLVRMARLMAPATVGLGAVQVNIFINSNFASHDTGAVSWLDYAFRLLYLPIGLFGVALGTIATAGLARRAAEGDMDGLRLTLRQSLSMLAYLTVPATVGLMVMGVPIIRLIYQHGRFHAEDTLPTATALVLYSCGLVGYTGVKVLAPAFYALGRPRVPLLASGLAVLTNLLAVWTGYGHFGFRAIAAGTALGSLLNAALLVAAFERLVGGLRGHGLLPPVARMAAGAVVMGGLAWLLAGLLEQWLGVLGLAARLLTCLVPVTVGVLAYGLVTRALGVGEAEAISRMVRDRLRPAAGRAASR